VFSVTAALAIVNFG